MKDLQAAAAILLLSQRANVAIAIEFMNSEIEETVPCECRHDARARRPSFSEENVRAEISRAAKLARWFVQKCRQELPSEQPAQGAMECDRCRIGYTLLVGASRHPRAEGHSGRCRRTNMSNGSQFPVPA